MQDTPFAVVVDTEAPLEGPTAVNRGTSPNRAKAAAAEEKGGCSVAAVLKRQALWAAVGIRDKHQAEAGQSVSSTCTLLHCLGGPLKLQLLQYGRQTAAGGRNCSQIPPLK